MGLFPDKQIRLVGISIVVGIVMTMVYDVIQTGIEKGIVIDVGIKIVACLVSIFIGILLLYYFDITHKKTVGESKVVEGEKKVEETASDKLTRQMAWYGIKYGVLIALGAAFFASGIASFIAEYSLLPALLHGDQQAGVAINILSGWFYLLLILGGLLMFFGAMRGKQLTKAEKL